MLNKKILAVAVAAAISPSAFAAIDLNANTGVLVIANEAVHTTNDVDADGRITLVNGAATDRLDIQSTVGFSISKGTSKYARVDLTNGVFGAIVTGDLSVEDIGVAVVGATATLSSGGDGESFVIFEVAAGAAAGDADIQQEDHLVLATAGKLLVDNGETLSVQVRLFENAQDAIDAVGNGLSSSTGAAVEFKNALTGTISTPVTLTATVASGFTKFVGDVTAENLAVIDSTGLEADAPDADDGYVAAWLTPDVNVPMTINTAQAVTTFSGDFSFGKFTYGAGNTWTTDADGDLVTAGDIVDNGDGTVSIAAVNYTDQTLNVDLAGDAFTANKVAEKGSYQISVTGFGTATGSASVDVSEAAGTIVYDTTSIEISYLTTFSAYNQRVYIINNGSTDANYTTSFKTEAGVTATAGTAATGTVPAGEMLTIKASDLVTFDGKTRGAATIEIEAQASDIQATTQTVNLETSGTDTLVIEVQ